jgi:hypothetical protein
MKAPTVATLYPRHGDFVSLQERLDRATPSATSGCSPGWLGHPGWSGAPSRVDGAHRDRATAHTRVWPGSR